MDTSHMDLINIINFGGPERFEFFPNPSSGHLTINNPELSRGSLRVYNLTGSMVYQKDRLGSQESIDLRFLPKGLYVLRFNNYAAKLVLDK